MQCQGQRGVLEIEFAHTGTFMFHAHQSEFAELGWMGFFEVTGLVEARSAAAPGGASWRLWALAPVLLLATVVGVFVWAGDSLVDLVGRNPPPADEFDVRRVEFRPGEIRVLVRNPQPQELTIASVTVDDAIVPYTVDGPSTLGRLRSSTVVIPFDWVEDDPIAVGVTSSTGIETVEEIPAAVETPRASAKGFLGYGVIGLLVGVVPVALGLLWLPSLRRADPKWLAAFMALTAGLLSFLADRGAVRGVRAAGAAARRVRRAGARAARGRAQLPRDDLPLHAAVRRAVRSDGVSRSRRSSRSGSACTTSAKGSRSGRRSRSAS